MSTLRLALFGYPVKNSPSPGIHRAFGEQFGIDVEYQLIESKAGEFSRLLDAFRDSGGNGCNVTLPLKHLACDLAEGHSTRALLATAANTLWWDSDQLICADNTDGTGLVRDLEKNLRVGISGKRVLIMGAGGAAAGILGALLEQNPSQMTIANRTIDRAQSLASRHEALGEVRVVSLEDLKHHAPVDVVIDATSIGHLGELPEIPEPLLAGSQLCYSLNYGHPAQALGTWCAESGVTFYSGLGMLVEQAACAFEIWTGKTPDTAPVRKKLSDSER